MVMDQEARDLVQTLITAARPLTAPSQDAAARQAPDAAVYAVATTFGAIRATTVLVQAARDSLARATAPNA